MRLLPYLVIVGIFSFLLTSCRPPQDLVFRDYKNLTLDNVTFSDATIKVDLVYYNPNNVGLTLSRTDLDLFVDGTYLGHSEQNVQIDIPRRQEFTLPLAVKVDLKNLLKNGLTTMTNKEVDIRLVGNVKLGKAGVYKNFKVDYTSKQNFSMFK